MDPTTTLFTFMLETSPSIQSVQLVGSWDNFQRTYTMERDIRRACGQWKGCHSFQNVICDGNQSNGSKRNGGLKMGETYYYYYELDGATETHDPSLPSTTACPFLPGQTVNTLYVPVQQSTRKRSASANSAHAGEYRTMNPDDKFVAPRAAPPVPVSPAFRPATTSATTSQIATAKTLAHKRSTRSLSPTPAWAWSPRKLFSRKSARSRERDNVDCSSSETSGTTSLSHCYSSSSSTATSYYVVEDERRSIRSCSEGSRSRDISPESLRRFLVSDEAPAPLTDAAAAAAEEEQLQLQQRPAIIIPEDIAEENEDEDDNNFATSATSETVPFTGLSPPPTQRTFLSSSSSSTTLMPLSLRPETPAQGSGSPSSSWAHMAAPTRTPPRLPSLRAEAAPPRSRFSLDSSVLGSSPSSSSPASPESETSSNDIPSFYHSDEDEDEEDEEDDDGDFGFMPLQGTTLLGEVGAADSFGESLLSAFLGYSLPDDAPAANAAAKVAAEAPTAAVIRPNGEDSPVMGGVDGRGRGSMVLAASGGLGELVLELGWMAGAIGKNP